MTTNPVFDACTVNGPITGQVTATGSTTARTLANRAADRLNVKDFGAVLDGTTDDSAAFNAARAAAPYDGIIQVPAGGWHLNSNPTSGPATPVLWQLSGNCYTTGTTPVAGVGKDTAESFVAGSKYFGRQISDPDPAPVVRIDQTLPGSGGTVGFVDAGLKVNTFIPANASNLNNYGWGIQSVLTSAANGPGQHVGITSYAVRTAGNSSIWASNFSLGDTSGANSLGLGGLVAQEVDIFADGLDNAATPGGNRVGIDTVIGRNGAGGAPALAVIGFGVRVSGSNGDTTSANVTRAFAVTAGVTAGGAAFTTDLAVLNTGADAFRMAAGQTFAFDAAGVHTLRYDSGSGKLFYAVSGVNKFSIDASGNVRAAGTITGSVTP